MSNADCPCKNCKLIEEGGKRYPGCHSHCKEGIEWDAKEDARKQKIKEAKRGYLELDVHMSDKMNQYVRKRHQMGKHK